MWLSVHKEHSDILSKMEVLVAGDVLQSLIKLSVMIKVDVCVPTVPILQMVHALAQFTSLLKLPIQHQLKLLLPLLPHLQHLHHLLLPQLPMLLPLLHLQLLLFLTKEQW